VKGAKHEGEFCLKRKEIRGKISHRSGRTNQRPLGRGPQVPEFQMTLSISEVLTKRRLTNRKDRKEISKGRLEPQPANLVEILRGIHYRIRSREPRVRGSRQRLQGNAD